MLISGCDDYNIVEPRFYSGSEVVEFAECEGRPPVDTSGFGIAKAMVDSGGPGILPAVFGASPCWDSGDEQTLMIPVTMPHVGRLKVSILNSGGKVESVLRDRKVPAGLHLFSWVVEEDGVYALSLQTERETMVVWFEVN